MRDVQGLADAVQHLVDDAPDRLRRGKRARELAEQHYSAELTPIGSPRFIRLSRKVSRTVRR